MSRMQVDAVPIDVIVPGDLMAANHKVTGAPFACLVYFVAHSPEGVQISFAASNATGSPVVTESVMLFEYGFPVARLTQVE